jgi:hypothetical protein
MTGVSFLVSPMRSDHDDSPNTQQKNRGRGCVMAGYRIYFLNGSGGIEAADTVDVENDATATIMADHLQEALSEAYAGYEVWEGARQVAVRRDRTAPQPPQCLAEITERMQQSVLDREEYLRNSRLTLMQSRKLLQRIEALRARISGCKVAG